MRVFKLVVMICIMRVKSEKTVKDGKARCMDFSGIKRDLVRNIGTRSKASRNVIFSVPDQIEVAVMKRDVWNAYCYHGSIIDPNTGCDPIGKTVLLPDSTEAGSWFKMNKCQIGVSCAVLDESCLGDGAWKCFNNELTHWVSSARGGYDSWWKKFPHHTCAKNWNCEIRKSMMVPVVVENSGIKVEINIMDEWYTLYQNGNFTKYFKSDRNSLVVYVPEFKVSLGSEEIKCTNSGNSTECLVRNSLTGSREIIELGKSEWSIGRTTAIKGAKGMKASGDIKKQREEFSRAASINDLRRAILATHYTQAEIDNSFDMVNMNFVKISNIIMGLLEYTTKKDDRAFSTIMRNNKIMKWISPEIVRICRTHGNFWRTELGCVNGSHYAGGSYHSTRRYKCNIPGKILKPYNLDLNLERMSNLTLYDIDDLGTTSSERINRELTEDRIRNIEARMEERGQQTTHSSNFSTGFLGYLSPSRLFSIISDYLVYINSAFILLLFLRK